MARAFPQSRYPDDDHSPAEWQSLREELVQLLDQVDSRVGRNRSPALSERARDVRHEAVAEEEDLRHRDALKSVQRAIHRFEEPAPAPQQQMAPNPRDSLQAAINQIRARQDNRPAPPPAAAPHATGAASQRAAESPMFDKLAVSMNGLSGRLESLEGEIKAQLKSGANIKDVADQVAQLAHVVELLAGAVGETGQVKRLEGQIASLGKIMAQGREVDIQTLTRRMDDVAATVGKLAELQVHFADKVENPVQSQAFKDGMASIEQSVRAVYDRIDSLERQRSLAPQDLDHVTSEMAKFTEAMREGSQQPVHLVELVDALNTRIADLETGDAVVRGLRKDLNALRDAVIVSLSPRFDAIEQHMQTLSTREDMAEIGRQLGQLSNLVGERPIDPGIGHIEAQVRQLVARMDQTGEQLSGLAKLYSEPTTVQMPDFDAIAEMVASRTAAAVQQQQPGSAPAVDFDAIAEMVANRAAEALQQRPVAPADTALAASVANLEQRITGMLHDMRRDPDLDAYDGMQAGIREVNERLTRLESSLTARARDDARPAAMAALIADAERSMPTPAPKPRSDAMNRNPSEDAPLVAPAFPEPVGPVATALEAKNGPRKRHPGLTDETSLASRYDEPVAPVAPQPSFEPEKIEMPPAPQPSPGFMEASIAETAPQSQPQVTASSRNTFIEAARRAAQRQTPAKPEVHSNSLIGRALARFQTGGDAKLKDAKAEPAPRKPLAGDKPLRTKFKPEPVVDTPAPAPVVTSEPVPAPTSLEPQIAVLGPEPKPVKTESFLVRNRKTILLGAAVVALAFLTINLVAQRLNQQTDAPAPAVDTAPATTGDITNNVLPSAEPSATQTPPARVIPMVDSLNTGSIDRSTAQGFTTSPQTMPDAFAPANVANADPAASSIEPDPSPVKVELPPDGIGPTDLRQAAANGDPRAQFEVAAIYTEGRAVPQDYKLAATWYERAAAQGFAPAQYRLGSLYEEGQGVSKDLNTAKLWYERAAEAGNRMSMHNLAALYAGGQLGKQEFDSAAKWFEEAAARGMTDSQFNLGMLYARGLGVPQDMSASYKWFGIAALSGDKDAAKARDDIARSLDADTVAKLNIEVNTFKPASIDLAANFAPIGTWTKTFDPGETITSKDIVLSVQKALGKLGYDVGNADGIAGAKTATAIKSFEKSTGMSEVGLINPRLLAVLGSQPV